MQLNDSTLLMLLLLLLLALAMLVVAFLAWRLSKANQNNLLLLTNLLVSEKQNSQSLLNQLRSQSPQDLNALQYATKVSNSNDDDEYVPSFDEGAVYEENLRKSEYQTVEAPDEFNSAGWDSVTYGNAGGNPVEFDGRNS